MSLNYINLKNMVQTVAIEHVHDAMLLATKAHACYGGTITEKQYKAIISAGKARL